MVTFNESNIINKWPRGIFHKGATCKRLQIMPYHLQIGSIKICIERRHNVNNYQKFIPTSSLRTGMFVCKLPIAWNKTPFPLQGFFVRSKEDQHELEKYCNGVYIDTIRSKEIGKLISVPNHTESIARNVKEQNLNNATRARTKEKTSLTQLRVKPITLETARYITNKPIHKEYKVACHIHKKILTNIPRIIEKINIGDVKDLKMLKAEAHNLVESAIRNPHALIWLTKLENDRKDIFQYALNASIWGLILGRHIGLNKEALSDLTLSLLLSKIGFIIKKERHEEHTEIDNNFVNRAVKALKDSAQFNSRIITTVQTHQERFDGSGGPKGILGDKIPFLGKLAGIADYYESLTNPISEKTPLISSAATALIYSLSNIKFQQDLVEAFIKAIGVYPIGTLVELSNAEVGYVLENEERSKLSPKVMLILDQNKKPLRRPKICNLSDNKSPVIRRSLPFGTHNVDIRAFKPSTHQGLFS